MSLAVFMWLFPKVCTAPAFSSRLGPRLSVVSGGVVGAVPATPGSCFSLCWAGESYSALLGIGGGRRT